jgi:hypothetical protein
MRPRLQLLALVPILLAGTAGSATTLVEREADPAFDFRQRNPQRLEPPQVEEAVRAAPEPAERRQTPAVSARCTPGTEGDLRNPWTCTIRYQSGTRYEYLVTLDADGRFRGSAENGVRQIEGCCVEQPGE